MLFIRHNADGLTEIPCDLVQPVGNLEGEDCNGMRFHLLRAVQGGYELITIVPVVEFWELRPAVVAPIPA